MTSLSTYGGLLAEPLRFSPLFRHYVWGGRRLAPRFTPDAPDARLAEVWLLSGLPTAPTPVADGPLRGAPLPELIQRFGASLVGHGCPIPEAHRFPWLLKALDVDDWLSVQVHPTTGNEVQGTAIQGKTEMWIAAWAAGEAQLILGVRAGVTPEDLAQCGPQGDLVDLLHRETVSAGDVFFVESGQVHALGPGMTMLEIQETSDATFRLYDWDRPHSATQPRPLHWAEALEALRISATPPGKVKPETRDWHGLRVERLAHCPHFLTHRVTLAANQVVRGRVAPRSCEVWVVASGGIQLTTAAMTHTLSDMECMLLPAAMGSFTMCAMDDTTLLVVQSP